MATLLRLKLGDSGNLLNLNSSSTGFRLVENGWDPVVATPVHMSDPPPVLETINLLLSYPIPDVIATSMQTLHEMQVLADRYINDPTQEDPVWLHAQMDGETNERRALVRSITMQYKPQWFGAGESTINIPLVITVVREPYWESLTARDLPDHAEGSGSAAIVYDYTAAGDVVSAHNIVGDVGARVVYWDMKYDDTRYYWMGIRSANKHGSTGLSNFEEVWELEDGTNLDAGDVADAVDASASGGNRVTVSEVGTNWDDGNFHSVLVIQLDDVTANEEDNLGNFLWLLRSKISTGTSTTWEVQLTFGYSLGSAIPTIYSSNIVEIDNNSWQIEEMGHSSIGHRNIHAIRNDDVPYSDENNFAVGIQARRTAGTADLHLDCLMPIPVDEGFCYIKSAAATDYRTTFGFAPDGVSDSVTLTAAGKLTASNEFGPENFRLPPGDGRVYIVTADQYKENALEQLAINDGDIGKYYECWLSLRGSE
jgi:hypothetical protein